jgi:hypothetical protein
LQILFVEPHRLGCVTAWVPGKIPASGAKPSAGRASYAAREGADNVTKVIIRASECANSG